MSEKLAKLFHETYERLAPTFGYETRKDSAVPWADVPEMNKRLMIAVADHVEIGYFANENAETEGNDFYAVSGFGRETQQPFVQLSYNGRVLSQMSPEDAFRFAHNVAAVAEASLSDAFLFTFMLGKIGLDEREAAGMMMEFREWRIERAEKLAEQGQGR